MYDDDAGDDDEIANNTRSVSIADSSQHNAIELRGVYDHTGLRSKRIKILRGIFLGTQGGLWKV